MPIEIIFNADLPAEPGLWLHKGDLGEIGLIELTYSGADLVLLPSELGYFRRCKFHKALWLGGEWSGPLVCKANDTRKDTQ